MQLRRLRALSIFATASLTLVAYAGVAHAGAKDKEAQKLLDQAMNEDYLNTDFAKAEKKLKDALKRCGKDACAKPIVAKLHIALGTVQGAGNKLGDAKNEFVLALRADSGAALDPALTTPELAKAFKEAQSEAGGGGKATPPPSDTEEEPATPKKPGKSGGDIPYKATVTEQVVNTPVPIYIEIPEDYAAEKATLQYKPFGGKQWKPVEMKKVGDGFAGEIPCEDVTATGDVKYYIVAKDASNEPVGQAGSRTEPLKVSIKNEIEGDAPTVPGQKAPSQCKAKEDCPPGFPGCEKGGAKHGDKGWGDSCETSEECKAGYSCKAGSCEEGGGEAGEGGEGGDKPKSKVKRNFVSLVGGADLLFVSSADTVCSGGASTNVYCFSQADSSQQFYGRPANVTNTNAIQGGIVMKPRFLLGYDRQLSEKIPVLLGARIGFAPGGPSSPSNSQPSSYRAADGTKLSGRPEDPASGSIPLHAELRVTYSFGAFEKKKLRGGGFINGGLAQVNGSVPVTVCNTVDLKGRAVANSPSGTCKGHGQPEQLDAYQITGRNFVGFGGFVGYAFTPTFGLQFELKAMIMFPTSGFVLEPAIGPVLGF